MLAGSLLVGLDGPVVLPFQSVLDWNVNIALQSMPRATTERVKAFSATDFRQDLPH